MWLVVNWASPYMVSSLQFQEIDGTGAEIQRPLATVVVCGLFTSTATTLLVTPTIYRMINSKPGRGEAEAKQVGGGIVERLRNAISFKAVKR
jgi:hypothetical protein